ncbi:DUF4232 domain-containing protein [Nocardia nova]|uniref:DUF4232 domain-containing protein n=1 Tax=Nocardia nova TaxID=37330 RepID=UPI00340B5512
MRPSRMMGWLLAVTAVSVAGCAQQTTTESHGADTAAALHAGALSPDSPAPGTQRAESVVSQCRTPDLSATAGPANAAAGTVAFPIVFTNNGPGSCVLSGFPGVSYADGADGGPVGAPAVRENTAADPVEIASGAQASALVLAVNVQNIPADQCRPVQVAGLRIYPPDNTESLYVERSGTACGNAQVTTAQLRVRPVVAGADGH